MALVHTAHQAELCKIPNTEFNYLRQGVRKWGLEARPLPKNVKWVSHFDPKKYDLCLLHTDQDVVHRVSGKSSLFLEVSELVKDSGVPVIVINHGTPYHPEAFQDVGITERQHIKYIVGELQGILKPVADHIINNSHQATKMMGIGETIWHGMDTNEWKSEPKEPRAIVSIAPAGWSAYYNRPLLTEVKRQMKEKLGYEKGIFHCMADAEFTSFEAYSQFVGRSLVYFFPGYQSPMPRSRTEAMHAGCCVVTTKHHDADKFIENGVNGFVVPDNPEYISNLLVELLSPYRMITKRDASGKQVTELAPTRYPYEKVVEIGKRGQKTAREVFNGKRFRDEWEKTIKQVLNKKGNNVKEKYG